MASGRHLRQVCRSIACDFGSRGCLRLTCISHDNMFSAPSSMHGPPHWWWCSSVSSQCLTQQSCCVHVQEHVLTGPGSPTQSADSMSSLSDTSLLNTNTQDILKPLGLLIDNKQFAVSPRSERAYTIITSEFDRLFEQLYQNNELGLVSSTDKLATVQLAASACIDCLDLLM